VFVKDFPTITINSIDDFEMPDQPTAYKIDLPGFTFDFYVKPQPLSQKIYVFSPGYMERASFTLPFFQRLRWSEIMDATVIIVSDPALALDDKLSLCWFQGTARNYFLPQVAEALRSIISSIGVPLNRVLFYGSSAGGFVSLVFAAILRGSCAVVNNPQTDICNFQRGPVTELLDICFDGISIEQAREHLRDRFNVAQIFADHHYLPNFIYVQNLFDSAHVTYHMQPFIEQIGQFGKMLQSSDERNIFLLYRGPETNHNPLLTRNMIPYFKMAESLFFSD
jgi:pimeloyl-ACP methyl ester carboxylesterase